MRESISSSLMNGDRVRVCFSPPLSSFPHTQYTRPSDARARAQQFNCSCRLRVVETMRVLLPLIALYGVLGAHAGSCKSEHKTQKSCDADHVTGGGCVWCDIVDQAPFCTELSDARQWPKPPQMPPWQCDFPPQPPAYPTVTLNNGIEMPVMALGTGGYNDSFAADAVAKALSVGMNHVHSAYDYYNLAGVGEGLRTQPRNSIFLTTMTSPCVHAAKPQRNVTDPNACYTLTLNELEKTLELLDVEYVDLVMLHGPSEPFGYLGGCDAAVCALNRAQWKAYMEFYVAGKARAIGVSNFCQSCLDCLLDTNFSAVVPAVNQIQLHVGMGYDPEGLFSYCRKRGIITQAYSPLAAGEVVKDPLCQSVGKHYNKTGAEVGVRWVLQQPFSPALVVKSDKLKNLQADLDAFSWSLTDEDVATLSKATTPKGQQNGRPSWGCSK